MSLPARSRSRIGALAVAALALGGLVAATPASAATTESAAADGFLSWGFRESFRHYVGRQTGAIPPIGAVPVGERITLVAPAQFDLDRIPAVLDSASSPNETLPYLLPVHGFSLSDSDNFTVQSSGGAAFHFPSHTFDVTVRDIGVVAIDGEASLVGDITVVVSENEIGYDAGTHVAEDVTLGEVGSVDVTMDGDLVTVIGSDVTLTAEGADDLQGYLAAGDDLDDFTLRFRTAPSVTASRTVFADDGASQVTVEGRGFYFGSATGTRMPLPGKPAGTYVALGFFSEVWKPSEGSSSASRPAVSFADGGQKWAVPVESIPSPISPSAGGIVLAPNGAFSTELVVDKAVIDAAAWGKVTEGRYGVYTYPGSGAVAPSFETFSPIEFRAVPAISVAPASAALPVGSTASFSVTASGADAVRWQSRSGSGGWIDVAGATSTSLKVPISSVAQSGTQYRAVATNPVGTVTSGAATLTVTKAKPTVRVAVKKSFRFASKTKATISVTAPAGVAASGKVTVRAGSTVVGSGTVKDGKASVSLSRKLLPGSRSLVAQFTGNADLTAATSASTKVKVVKASAKITAKLAKKSVKASKRATLRVKVTASGVKPAGKVKVTVSKGKEVVRTLTVKVRSGKTSSVRLPKLRQGKYTVKATFQGSKTVTKKSAKKVTLRVR